ncbi:hypothetical protein LIER_37585 [Lithospermum erythrorhizon]|uniref:Retrovirus-related Pol polyprotein from transposon TNT 1-94-like beta-barrel domain-containing protein n=1 Tax=Lithospermum erythrorhizon TaxID=34254 RepID=A0AAV3PMG5_LITER
MLEVVVVFRGSNSLLIQRSIILLRVQVTQVVTISNLSLLHLSPLVFLELLLLVGNNSVRYVKKGYHSALNCSNHFNHAYTSSKVQHFLATMHLTGNEGTVWYPDSGTSAHMTGDSSILQSLIPYHGSTAVMVGDGSLLSISQIVPSSIPSLGSKLILKDVLYVPALTKNLLSINKRCVDNKCIAEFSSEDQPENVICNRLVFLKKKLLSLQ